MGRFAKGLLIVEAPVCANDYQTLSSGSSINVPVTENDGIPAEFTINITKQPGNGTAGMEPDNSITYIPRSRF